MTMMTFKSRARLRYSPTNNGREIRRDGGSTKWWLVADCDPEIGRYYRELYRLNYYSVHTIQRPSWGAHISIISDEKPPDETHWRKHEGKLIEFEYSYMLEGNGMYVWLPVLCEKALDIREELGLKRNPFYPLHLTIGNRKG